MDANAVTLQTYGQAMERWRDASCRRVSAAHQAFLEQLVSELPAGGSVLEIGAGSGRDADWLEAHGLTVRRTDGCAAFVAALREQGHEAELLNVLLDPLPSGFDAVYANAVLLHLEADDLPAVLTRLAGSAPLLAFTVKVGEGAGWSTAKTGLPRFFQYWTEESLRSVLARSPWQVGSLEQRPGLSEEWLMAICRTAG